MIPFAVRWDNASDSSRNVIYTYMTLQEEGGPGSSVDIATD